MQCEKRKILYAINILDECPLFSRVNGYPSEMGHFLNPGIFYNDVVGVACEATEKGLYDCIMRLFVIRALSLICITCRATSYERNWSVFQLVIY
uniref:Uncharacterized protein n=1 Tax=Lactuca sativa TaxID=4236 RepID=A0A9R1WCP3_LACSA|nr:hypothetical protein LSAT_V11C200084480 [Lactuca sativa]